MGTGVPAEEKVAAHRAVPSYMEDAGDESGWDSEKECDRVAARVGQKKKKKKKKKHRGKRDDRSRAEKPSRGSEVLRKIEKKKRKEHKRERVASTGELGDGVKGVHGKRVLQFCRNMLGMSIGNTLDAGVYEEVGGELVMRYYEAVVVDFSKEAFRVFFVTRTADGYEFDVCPPEEEKYGMSRKKGWWYPVVCKKGVDEWRCNRSKLVSWDHRAWKYLSAKKR